MSRLSALASILLFLVSGVAEADLVGPYPVGTIEVTDSGTVYISTPPNLASFPNPHGCTHANWIVIDPSTPLATRALAVAMAAQASGAKVKFNLVGCLNGYIKAGALQTNAAW